MHMLYILHIHILYRSYIFANRIVLFYFVMLDVDWPPPQFWLLENRAEVLDCDTAMLATEVIKHGREMPCHAKCQFNIGI